MDMDAPAPSPTLAAPEAVPATAPVPLLNRNFLLIWGGQTTSQLGNQAYSLAMMFWLMEATGSASLMGLVMMFSSIPALLLSPFGGAFADRHSRIRIIIVCDLIAGAALGGLAAAMWIAPTRTKLLIGCLFGVATVLGLVRSVFMPAVAATIPVLVPKERLMAANSLNQFSIQAALFVGQAGGGILYKLLGAPALFLIDAVSFLISGGASSLVRVEERKRDLGPAKSVKETFRSYGRDLAEGFRYVWKYKGFRYFLGSASLMNFLMMPVIVLFPFYVSRYLGKGSEWYGFLVASLSVGTVCAFIISGFLRLQGPRRAWTILGGMLTAPFLYGTLGFVNVPLAALAGCFGFGLALGIVNVNLMTIAQTSTPNEMRGRVMGLVTTLSAGLVPLGMALGGFVGDLTGKNVPLVYSVCGALTVILILATCLRKDTREYLAWGRQERVPGTSAA